MTGRHSIARTEALAEWPGTVALDPSSSFDQTNTKSLSDNSIADFPLDAPAFVLCTSGSSGHPKPIAHSQRTMLHWVRASHDGMHINTADRVLSLSSPSALGGFVALLSNPLAGATIQLFDIKLRKITGLLDLLAAEPVTILRAAPSLLRCIVQLADAQEAFAGLRLIQSYGEPLLMSDIHDLRKVLAPDCFIRSTYGSTEASGLSWFAHPLDCQDSVRVPAGMLMPDTEATILADDGTPCEGGVTGELIIRSRYNALGEWVDARLIAGRLQSDPEDPVLKDMHQIGRIAALAIERRQPSGPVVLAGYSFGGSVAYEAARALINSGREVALLAIFDSKFATGVARTAAQSRRWNRRSMLRAALSWDFARAAILSALNRLPRTFEYRIRRYLFRLFREDTLHSWSPSPLDVATFLAVSEEYEWKTLGIWRWLCQRLCVVHLPGEHIDIFKIPAADLLIPAFEDQVLRATAENSERASAKSVRQSRELA